MSEVGRFTSVGYHPDNHWLLIRCSTQQKRPLHSNRITKRGSSRLRHALYMAVLCGLRRSGSKKLKAFYDKKMAEGTPHKVAMIACVNKLLHWLFALLKRKETFLDSTS